MWELERDLGISSKFRFEEGLVECLVPEECFGEVVVVLWRPEVGRVTGVCTRERIICNRADSETSTLCNQTEHTLDVLRVVWTVFELDPRPVHKVKLFLVLIQTVGTAEAPAPVEAPGCNPSDQEGFERISKLLLVGLVGVWVRSEVCVRNIQHLQLQFTCLLYPRQLHTFLNHSRISLL